MASSGRISRQCLGANVSLGDVYDATSDTFTSSNVFASHAPNDIVETVESHFTQFQTVVGVTFAEKCQLMGLSGEEQVSLLASAVKPKGAALYLTEHHFSAGYNGKSWILITKTVNESINYLDDEVGSKIVKSAVDAAVRLGTHVVQEISYGATITICGAEKGNEASDIFHVVHGEVEYFGDVPVLREEIPSKLEKVDQFFKTASCRLAAYNDGKGVPQTMSLISIQNLQMYVGMVKTPDSAPIFKPLGLILVGKIVRAFAQLRETLKEIGNAFEVAQSIQHAIRPPVLESISKLVSEMDRNKFRDKLATTVVKFRSGSGDAGELDELALKVRDSCTEAQHALRPNWAEVNAKSGLLRLFESNGIGYIGNGGTPDDELSKTPSGQTLFVLYYLEKGTEEPERWDRNMRLFLNKSEEERGRAKFIVVDCGLQANSKIVRTCVKQLKDGKIVVPDLLEVEDAN